MDFGFAGCARAAASNQSARGRAEQRSSVSEAGSAYCEASLAARASGISGSDAFTAASHSASTASVPRSGSGK